MTQPDTSTSNEVSRICIDLRRAVDYDGEKLLQARWLPITLNADKAITPNGAPSDWETIYEK